MGARLHTAQTISPVYNIRIIPAQETYKSAIELIFTFSMENELVWILISELLENSHGYSVHVGRIDNKDTWILKNNKKEAVAYQIMEHDKTAFFNVYCLIEKHPEKDLKQSPPEVIAFLIKGNS